MSLGRKPVPGGETKVSRTLERTVDSPVEMSCAITPIPSLLAEPSQPRAMRRFFWGGFDDIEVVIFVLSVVLVWVGMGVVARIVVVLFSSCLVAADDEVVDDGGGTGAS